MYLKYIRHNHSCGDICRGTLYSVHFQPNEKGGYNETLTPISDAYETSSCAPPLPLIFPAGIRRVNGHARLFFGRGNRQSTLHLIDSCARDAFFIRLASALREREETLVEVADPFYY